MKIEEFENDPHESIIEKKILEVIIYLFDEIKKKAATSWETVFTTRTVDELLFGYNDSFLELIHKYKPSLVPSPVFSFQVSVQHCSLVLI